MRTAKQRPGSRFRGRGAAAEGKRACLGPYPGPWENIPRTVTVVERYQFAAGLDERRGSSVPGASRRSARFLWSFGVT